jgi:hypothetical protein
MREIVDDRTPMQKRVPILPAMMTAVCELEPGREEDEHERPLPTPVAGVELVG